MKQIGCHVMASCLLGAAVANSLTQKTASTVEAEKTEHIQHHHMVSDPFFSQPDETKPADSNLALTRAFIFSTPSKKKVKMGTFEMDAMWIYVFAFLIIAGAVIGGIICCSSSVGGDELATDGEQKEEDKMDEEQKMMEGDMMGMDGDMMGMDGDMAMGE